MLGTYLKELELCATNTAVESLLARAINELPTKDMDYLVDQAVEHLGFLIQVQVTRQNTIAALGLSRVRNQDNLESF